MAEEMKNLSTENATEEAAPVAKSSGKAKKQVVEKTFLQKTGDFFKATWKKIKKFTTDTINEMKKVVWTPKAELKKSTVLVVVAVAVIATAIAVIDSAFSWAINSIAGLFPII